ncbi:ABC transporter substrate-binding protein [Actinomyces minihominis]|uniref:ABC transporter substrate-binding protein n=1 Tax=Actinomyces minihominis TaxID=2002838 RepID=UPI000C07968B|nr:ABC transporter substrate-binding protein [Actinomyces minihominis]
MKKIASLVSLGVAGALALAGCSASPSASSGQSESPEATTEYVVGISQLMDHPSLTAAADGFKAAFEDAGLTVKFDEQNANGDQSTAASIAGSFKSSKVDLVLAIATPTAQAAAQAITDIPVLFTAVTDPIDAGLVETWEAPGGNITGTSDANPVSEQLALIEEIVPGVKTVGIVYSPGEANSVVQVGWAKDAAAELGLEIIEAPAMSSQDVQQATESLADVDAIYVPTDNVVVTSLETVLQVGETKKIPVFGAEGDSVARGAIATYGLDYFALGYQTGQMAISILTEGKAAADIPVATLTEPSLYLNLGAAERMGVEVPVNLVEQADPENITN